MVICEQVILRPAFNQISTLTINSHHSVVKAR